MPPIVETAQTVFSNEGLLPHGHCYLWQPSLVWLHVISDSLIGFSYVAISLTLYFIIRKIKVPFSTMILSFGIFIGACGATHFMEVWTLWNPDYWVSGLIKALTAVASVATAIWLVRLRSEIFSVATNSHSARERGRRLEKQTQELIETNNKLLIEIADRKKAEEELWKNKARMRAFTEGVKDYAIFTLDRAGFVESWNEGAKRINGYEAKEIIGKHFSIFYSEEDKQNDVPGLELEEALQNDRVEQEGWRYRKDGSKFWANAVVTPIKDPESAEVIGFTKITRDMTDRKRVQDELRQSHEGLERKVLERTAELEERDMRFRHLADSMPQIVWSAGPNGVPDYFNERWYDYTGLEKGKIAPNNERHAIIHPEDRQRAQELWMNSLKSGDIFQVEYRLKEGQTDQYRWFLARAIPSKDGKGNVTRWYGTCTDIDNQRQSTERLAEAVKARDEFMSIASHELKTPLTSLKLQAQLTKRHLNRGNLTFFTEDTLGQFANQLDVQVDRLVRLVDDMLDISRIRSGKLTTSVEEFDLSEVTQGVIERLLPVAKATGSQIIYQRGRPVVGLWDKYRIEQILNNLISNAIKYGSGKPIHVDIQSSPDKATLRVKDHGIGIPHEDKEKIFERFERATPPSEISGLGLGLYIVKQILKAHSGTIRVESQVGHGSEFIVELPLQSSYKSTEKRMPDYEF